LPLQPPEQDSRGIVLPHDHPEIPADWRLIRRISDIAATQWVVTSNNGGKRLSSACLTASSPEYDPYEGISIDLETVAKEEGVDLVARIRAERFVGAIVLTAGAARVESLRVGYDPKIENICHGQIWGKPSTKKRQRLLKTCDWYIPIPEVSLGAD
jgi:hypothetical protein